MESEWGCAVYDSRLGLKVEGLYDLGFAGFRFRDE